MQGARPEVAGLQGESCPLEFRLARPCRGCRGVQGCRHCLAGPWQARRRRALQGVAGGLQRGAGLQGKSCHVWVDMVFLYRGTTAGHANAQCSTGVCSPKLARCACTAPSRVLEGATAGQHRPDPGPARRLAAASPVFRAHVIICDRDPALGGAWAALRARYRARGAKVNNRWQPRCATCRTVYINICI